MEPWSWLLTAVGVTGIWLAGRKNLWGWAIGFAAQGLWVAFALATEQYGFIVSALVYGGMYGKNFLRWRREARSQNLALPTFGPPLTYEQIAQKWRDDYKIDEA